MDEFEADINLEGVTLGKHKKINHVSNATAIQIRAAVSKTKSKALSKHSTPLTSQSNLSSYTAIPGISFKKQLSKVPLSAISKISKSEEKLLKSQNPGISRRAKKDEIEKDLEPSVSTAWIALQRKAALYDKLRTGEMDEDDVKESLVDFVRKNHNDPVEEDEEEEKPTHKTKEELDPWVEVTDEFGRSRVIRQSEKLKLMKKFVKSGDIPLSKNNDGPTMLSDDMRLQMEREEWEQREREEMNQPYVRNVNHYDSKAEVRNLGVGFYSFSQSDEQRRTQMEELKNLREETIVSRDLALNSKISRKEKIEERKRLIQEKKKKLTDKLGDTTSISAESKVKNEVDEFFRDLEKTIK